MLDNSYEWYCLTNNKSCIYYEEGCCRCLDDCIYDDYEDEN